MLIKEILDNPPNIELVKATTSDAEAILEMQIACFTPHFEHYQDYATSPVKEPLEKMIFRINYEKGSYFKIMADSVHVGCLWIYEKQPQIYRIGIICILPQFQCKGIGKKALEAAERLFPEAKAWELECPEDIVANRICYEKMGYRDTGETKVINEKLTLISYQKGI